MNKSCEHTEPAAQRPICITCGTGGGPNDVPATSPDGPLYPDVVVPLIGEDGNAMAIMGRVSGALRRYLQKQGMDAAGVKNITGAYMQESMSGDYANVLATAQKYVTAR